MPDFLLSEIPMRPERDDWAKISVRMTGRGAEKPGVKGIVRVDGNQSLDLVGGRASTFRVEPGEHVVSVRFKRRSAVSAYPGRAECSLSVTLSPREEVRLHCGIRAGAQVEWARTKNAKFVESVMLVAGYLPVGPLAIAGLLLATKTAPSIDPLVHNLSVWVGRFLGLQGPWATLFVGLTGSSLAVTIWIALLWSLLVIRLIGLRHPDRGRNDSSRIQDPYFLAGEDSQWLKTCSWIPQTELSF